jgi:hypothetical protein
MESRNRYSRWAGAAAIAAGVVSGCQAQPGGPHEGSTSAAADEASTVLSFSTMVGVDGGFVSHNPIRGVRGDELPWEIASAQGTLTSDGHITLDVTGVVFADYPTVPADLRGINDESEFRALVSCLFDDGHGRVSTVNLTTAGFPASPTGDSNIDGTVELPSQCVAPIVFLMSGSEDLWFAVTGVESETD